MSDPLLDKMDALLKRHQGSAEPSVPSNAAPSTNAPPPLPEDAWLPVLTDVVAVGEPGAAAAPTPAAESAEMQASTPPTPAIDPEVLVERVMDELELRLTSLLRDRLLSEVRNSLDDSLSALLAQMDVHIREIVREAVAEQLGKS